LVKCRGKNNYKVVLHIDTKTLMINRYSSYSFNVYNCYNDYRRDDVINLIQSVSEKMTINDQKEFDNYNKIAILSSLDNNGG